MMEIDVVPAVFIRKPNGSRGSLLETGDIDYLFKKYDRRTDVLFGSKAVVKNQNTGAL